MYSTGNVGSLPLLCEPLYQKTELFSAPKVLYLYIVIRLKVMLEIATEEGNSQWVMS